MQAHLNEQRDYITLRVGAPKGARINFTMSYSGQKCSGAGFDNAFFKRAFKAFVDMEKRVLGKSEAFKNYGAMMRSLKALADAAATMEAFVAEMERLIAEAPASTPKGVYDAPPADIVEKAKLIEEVPPPAKGSGPAPRTREELQAAFDLVKNQKDWKERIDRVIPRSMEPAVAEAISYFTGTTASFYEHKDPSKLIVRAAGYYRGPCN